MRKEKQDARRKLIEEAAYEILSERGYRSSSMLLIAKKAKASNETLYRWYGSKQGLFTALVEENARNVKEELEACLNESKDPIETLGRFGPALLQLVTSPRSIALNRAAAAEADNVELGTTLGDAIAKAEKEAIAPLVEKLFQAAADIGCWPANQVGDASQTYLSLLIGDAQIRRATGVQSPFKDEQCNERAQRALELTTKLFNSGKVAA